jgi:hypothetical protein
VSASGQSTCRSEKAARRGPTEADRVAAEEFRRQPFGRHSPQLQRLLDFFRREPFPRKHVLICTKPYREWSLAIFSGIRGDSPQLLPGHVFTSVAEAEWAVFKRRWQLHFGEELK